MPAWKASEGDWDIGALSGSCLRTITPQPRLHCAEVKTLPSTLSATAGNSAPFLGLFWHFPLPCLSCFPGRRNGNSSSFHLPGSDEGKGTVRHGTSNGRTAKFLLRLAVKLSPVFAMKSFPSMHPSSNFCPLRSALVESRDWKTGSGSRRLDPSSDSSALCKPLFPGLFG